MMTENNHSLGIIGCGNMGSALIENVRKTFKTNEIFVFDKECDKRNSLVHCFSVQASNSLEDLCMHSDVILIAVKPQDITDVLSLLKGFDNKLFISIAAGTTIASMESILGRKAAIVRVMPNLNALIAKSATALSFNGVVKEEHKKITQEIFSCIGDIVIVKEPLMNAVTAISGSGPAFVAYLQNFEDKVLEQVFIKQAEHFGIDRKTADILVCATISGTRSMISLNLDPDMLIKRVASKGGTTEAGLKVLDAKGKTPEALALAIQAAKQRADELSRLSSKNRDEKEAQDLD
jgi:pyrroline-5-carboxylate reductase